MTIYYVSKFDGNNGNSGLTEALAWKTLEKVNSSVFSAGDSILFNRGDMWAGTLIVTGSDSKDMPITFGAYGRGDKPIIGNIGSPYRVDSKNGCAVVTNFNLLYWNTFASIVAGMKLWVSHGMARSRLNRL